MLPAFRRYPAGAERGRGNGVTPGLPKYCGFKREEWHRCIFQEAVMTSTSFRCAG